MFRLQILLLSLRPGRLPAYVSVIGPSRGTFRERVKFLPGKSAANKAKHGIDFDAAQALWNDPDVVEIPARDMDEPRYLVISKISGKHWSAVINYRSDNIRLISVRQSRKEGVELYESLGFDKQFDAGEDVIEYFN